MLQQTQVATGPRLLRRASSQRFPDVAALARRRARRRARALERARLLRRARNLHRCAQVVVARARRRVPEPTSEALATLPGIGRSTAAAIAAFCFGERAAILDGNVKRVLARSSASTAAIRAQKRVPTRCGTRPSVCCPTTRHRGLHAGTDGPRRDALRALEPALFRLPRAPALYRVRNRSRHEFPGAAPAQSAAAQAIGA